MFHVNSTLFTAHLLYFSSCIQLAHENERDQESRESEVYLNEEIC